ncbi:MAG: hypothetical protein WC824_12580 [Bacteroidota bacterium]|jgi:hypothetical protein
MQKRLHLPLLLFLIMTLVSTVSGQQLQLQLLMNPNPSPYLSDWEQRQETATLQVMNPGNVVQAKLSAQILLDGTLQAKTNTAKMQILQIPNGVSMWDAAQILPFAVVDFYGGAKNTAVRSGMLPEGNYEICVELLSAIDGNALTQLACAYFHLVAYQAPVCLQPQDGSTLQSAPPPVFRWTPVIPTPPQPVHYFLNVFEVLQGQTPTQAFRSNQPILSEEVVSATQQIWPLSVMRPDTGKLVWSVQAKDENGNPVGGKDGWAEPITFSLGTATGIASGTGGGALFTDDPCAAAEEKVKKKKDEVRGLKDEESGIDREIAEAKKAAADCPSELEKAKKELEDAKRELQKQQNVHDNFEKHGRPGAKYPDKEAADKDKAAVDKALADAEAAVKAAEAKVKELKKRCPELTKALDHLKDRKSSLPDEIKRGETAVGDAERALEECIKKRDQCKEGETRDAPGKSATTETFLCSTPDTKFDVKITSSLDGALKASTGLSEHIKSGLKVIEKVAGKVPGAKPIVKLVGLPAKLGSDILAAIPKAGLFGRYGLETLSVDITIGPLHKFTLRKTDLEICKDGKWVPHDKKKCELIDEGEEPSTPISHTWKTDGSGPTDLSELTAAGTGFADALEKAIQKHIDDAVTTPEELEAAQKDCQ